MPRVVFEQPNRELKQVDAPLGISVMDAARQHGLAGIVAQCGGACSCATCHVYVDPAWLDKLHPPDDMELGMLESAWHPQSNSRLSCQLRLTAALDGLRVTIPERQCSD